MKNTEIHKYFLLTLAFLLLSAGRGLLFAQWQPDVRLTNDTANSYSSFNNAKWIASSGNTLHVVWSDFRNGNYDIFYKRSTNNGANWSNETRINDSSFLAERPAVAVSGSYVHVAWMDERHGQRDEIYYKRSTDGGLSWGNDVRLTNDTNWSTFPSISCLDSSINVVWTDLRDGNAEIYYKRSTNNGSSWSSDVRLTNAPNVSQFPSVGQSGSNIHVIWDDQRNLSSVYHIYYKRSTDGGSTWSNDLQISNQSLDYGAATISVSGSYIHIAWVVQVQPLLFDIFYKNSSDNGLSWGTDTRLTYTDSAGRPSLVSSGAAVHLVLPVRAGNSSDIFYKRSTNNGTTWDTLSRLTNDPALSELPSVTVSYSSVHLVWNDTRNGNSEIYYKTNSNANGIYTISGLATFRDNSQPVPGGHVKALKYDQSTSEIITVDSTIINSNGTYMFQHIPEGEFDIMFYQDDDMLQFVPTYYISTIDWRQSTKVIANQNLTNINCQVYRINNQSNPFTISGTISSENDNMILSGIKDGIVYVKAGDLFKNYGISSGNGSYLATKLAPGTYSLTTYRMGFDPVSQDVTIVNSNLTNINFNLGHPVIGITEISSEIPKGYSLNQNYPNPFNPVTNIVFGIPKSGLTTIKIYDILGRVVSSIVDENLKAGTYSVKWNGESFASGIYFYRLETTDYNETRKMVMIK